MDKKGFTLVELIGVIILFGAVLIAVASPMLAQISKQQKRLEDSQIEVLKAAAEEYVDANITNYPKTAGSVYYVSLLELYYSGIIDDGMGLVGRKQVQFPQDRLNNVKKPIFYPLPEGRIANFMASSYMKISVVGNRYKYDYIEDLDKEGLKPAYELKDGDYVYYSGITWKVYIPPKEEEDPYSSPYSNPYSNTYSASVQYANPDEEYSVSKLRVVGPIKGEDPEEPFIYLEAAEPVSSIYYQDGEFEPYWGTFLASKLSFNNIIFLPVEIVPSEKHEYVSDGIDYVYPVVPIYSLTAVTGGNGTASNPYTLVEKLIDANNVSIKQKKISVGSYISIANKLYRIIGDDSNNIRVLLTSNTDLTGAYNGAYGQFNLLGGAGRVLDNLSVPDVFERTNFYTGYSYSSYYDSFMNSAQAKSGVVFDVKLALPKVTDLFTAPFIGQTNCYMTATQANYEEVYEICPDGVNKIETTETSHLNYVGVISKDNILTSGNGTYQNPYVLKIS